MGERHIGWSLLDFIAFAVLEKLWKYTQRVKWWLDGTSQTIQKNRDSENYAQSAQVFRVWAKRNLDSFLLPNDLSYFMLSHQGFVHPEYVLREEVSLYMVNQNEAVFVEAPPGVHV